MSTSLESLSLCGTRQLPVLAGCVWASSCSVDEGTLLGTGPRCETLLADEGRHRPGTATGTGWVARIRRQHHSTESRMAPEDMTLLAWAY